MNTRLSRITIGSIIWMIFLIVLAVGLVFSPPTETLEEDAQGWPRFDLQARLWAQENEAETPEAAIRAALEVGATTLLVDVAANDGDVAVVHDGEEKLAFSQLIALAEAEGGDNVRYSLDIAATPEEEADAVAKAAGAVVETLRAAGVADRATIRAFDWRVLAAVRDEAPEIGRAYRTIEGGEVEGDERDTVRRGEDGPSPWLAGLDVDTYGASLPRTVAAAESDDPMMAATIRPWAGVWAPHYRDLRETDFRKAKSLGLKVVVWTVNDPEVMALLLHLGVDGIVTDHPARLRAVMKDKEHPLPDRLL